MTTMETPRRVALRDALAEITVDRDGTHARVADLDIEESDPRLMRGRLADAIYTRLHVGKRHDPELRLPRRIRDRAFEAQLSAGCPNLLRPTRVRTATAVENHDGHSRVLIDLDGVRVWAPAARITESSFTPGDMVTLQASAIRPAVSPGFFLVQGGTAVQRTRDLLRIYVHIADSSAGVQIWPRVLEFLEANQPNYQAKILSAPQLYPRRDALVVYMSAEFEQFASHLAATVSPLPGIVSDTSVFAEQIAPGIATAREPRDPRPEMQGLSFGQHRSTALATALLAAARGKGELDDLLTFEFRSAGIDPGNPSRNHIGGAAGSDAAG